MLTMSGAEVEDVTPAAPPFSGVVVAEVKAVEKHPNADKLSVCQVDAGTGGVLNIVCGAPNVRAGMKVPCATIGAVLPGNFEIKQAKMRGVESHGMLCSARELGLSEDHGGLLELPATLAAGTPLRQAMDLDDQVLTLKLTPNKADCLSVFGIAREVAAITGAPLKRHTFTAVAPKHQDKLTVKVSAPDLCGRFSGRIVRNVNCKAPTPDWMKARLERAGQRSITALVDISNYVMLELGRPSHIFDFDKIAGSLQIRWGKAGETVKLLNGNTITVDETVGVIADDNGPEAMAGIMGGDHTAVSDDTRNIYIEAAFWWPDSIRGRARRYNFSTDAAHRFERGVDASTTVEHIEYITQLVLSVCGGEPGPMDDQVLGLPERKPVQMRAARCRKVVGADISDAQMAEVFTRLELEFTQAGGVFTVTPPAYRFDIEIEEDLIEEVARIWGYDKLPVRPPMAAASMRSLPESRRSAHHVRAQLAALGYHEAITYSFVDEQWERDFTANAMPLKLLNPMSSAMSVMRSSLMGNLVAALSHNLRHKQPRVRLFEVGRVFHADAQASDGPLAVKGVRQPMHVAAIAYGPESPEQWGVKPARMVDFFDIKGDVEALLQSATGVKVGVSFEAASHPALHPGRTAVVKRDGQVLGYVGELHPKWVQKYDLPNAPVLFELSLDALLDRPVPLYAALPRQQPVQRDVALVMDAAVQHQQLMATLHAATQSTVAQVVRNIELFDVYRTKVPQPGLNPGQKSCAVRITMWDAEPLTDAAADAAVAALVAHAEQSLGAKLRV
jgi:phenylalanyl-tRNA synthetase beta chain